MRSSELVFLAASAFAIACALTLSGYRSNQSAGSGGLTPIRLQLDWYPQPEHGGIFAAQLPIGKLLRESVDGDVTLMDYLVRDTLEVAAINRILGVIREMVDGKVKSIRVRSVCEIAKQRGFKPLPSAQEDERFDQITRF